MLVLGRKWKNQSDNWNSSNFEKRIPSASSSVALLGKTPTTCASFTTPRVRPMHRILIFLFFWKKLLKTIKIITIWCVFSILCEQFAWFWQDFQLIFFFSTFKRGVHVCDGLSLGSLFQGFVDNFELLWKRFVTQILIKNREVCYSVRSYRVL